MKLKITKNAFEAMEKASLGCETETGGLVVGTTKMPIGIRATGAGVSAIVSQVSYSNDPAHDEKTLHRIMREFNGRVKLIGYWHKHPGGMSCPSSGDMVTAQDIAQRIEKEGDQRPVFFIITNVIESKVKLFCYVLDYDKRFITVPLDVIDDGSDEVREALDAEPQVIQAIEMDFWKDPDFQFYRTEQGNERLYEEIAELRTRGYEVNAYARGQLYLVIKKDNETMTCLPPAEYPLNPPRVFRGSKEIRYALPIWNSSFRMAEILGNLDELKLERSSHENHLNKAGPRLSEFFRRVRRAIESLWPHKKK